jgi:hypothetical protein
MNHDEYTDYSCSTSIERLARDVETVLRSWHVDGGSDRHISVSSSSSSFQTTSNSSSKHHAALLSHSSASSVNLIRSGQLAWNVSFYRQDGTRISSQMDVDLSLWDGPRRQLDNEATSKDLLPFSIRRSTWVDEMPLDIFANFSTLFGIGQHLTLTPVNPDQLPDADLIEHLSESVWQRHHRSVTAVPAVATVLSSWLQTALNLAATASHCCIPCFGIWGHYQPQVNSSLQNGNVFPLWLMALQGLELPWQAYRRKERRRRRRARNGKGAVFCRRNRNITLPPTLD